MKIKLKLCLMCEGIVSVVFIINMISKLCCKYEGVYPRFGLSFSPDV